jgi:formyltetrahydrofolate-dependent phosphoribosylglycinamide formyltransferase
VVLLSGSGRTLQNLLAAVDEGRLDAEIALVISSRADVRGVQRAREAGLPVEILRRADHADADAFARAQTARILAAEPGLVVMAGYLVHYPVPAGLVGRILNIHPSLLPRYGGRGMFGDRVHAAVLASGDSESGCTVHVVDDEYDHGPIVTQTRVPVLPGDTVETLAARVFAAECATYPEAIAEYARRLPARTRSGAGEGTGRR